MIHDAPQIVGPFGLTLQWYMGIGTGFALGITCALIYRIRERNRFWKEVERRGYARGLADMKACLSGFNGPPRRVMPVSDAEAS